MKRAPKLEENPRTTLVVRGQKTSDTINSALTDLFMLKKPHAVHFKRHNAVHPFEDTAPLEFLCQKNDASLFAFGTHSKKRPHNLVLGRCFDHQVLDMYELGVEDFSPISAFAAATGGGCACESKPCVLFHGEWENDATLLPLRSLLLDWFQLEQVSTISPVGIEHALVFTAAGGGKLLIRHYVSRLLRSADAKLPRVELLEMGPSLDLSLRRTRHASADLMREAMRRPKAAAAMPKKVKNVTRSKLLGKQGRLHVPRQDLSVMATARMKALRKDKKGGEGGEGSGGGGKGEAAGKRKRGSE